MLIPNMIFSTGVIASLQVTVPSIRSTLAMVVMPLATWTILVAAIVELGVLNHAELSNCSVKWSLSMEQCSDHAHFSKG